MNRFELIEKLRERADINYEEAEQLLSDTQDDLIAALIILCNRTCIPYIRKFHCAYYFPHGTR